MELAVESTPYKMHTPSPRFGEGLGRKVAGNFSTLSVSVTLNRYVGSSVDLIFNRNCSQLGILSPIGDLKSPIGDHISNWGLGTHESGNAESEIKSPIPNWIKYHQLGI